jgi:murein DD-endopeptidase MepM/ murein hydrolase activator NlpD
LIDEYGLMADALTRPHDRYRGRHRYPHHDRRRPPDPVQRRLPGGTRPSEFAVVAVAVAAAVALVSLPSGTWAPRGPASLSGWAQTPDLSTPGPSVGEGVRPLGLGDGPGVGGPGRSAPAPAPAPNGQRWKAPVRAPVNSGFRTAERPDHNGVDLGAPRGTPIRAAAAGTVIVVRCNVEPTSRGCDVDGSSRIRGCGWYVDIMHQDRIVTRYCHMLVRPSVREGQSVAVGQVIGVVGTSGGSSGPHLHYEVHLGDRSSATAVNPVPFMAARKAPLG